MLACLESRLLTAQLLVAQTCSMFKLHQLSIIVQPHRLNTQPSISHGPQKEPRGFAQVEAQPPAAGRSRSRLPGGGPRTVGLSRRKVTPVSLRDSRRRPAAGWRPVQRRGRTRQRASCAPPPRSQPEPAAGWRRGPCSGEVVR